MTSFATPLNDASASVGPGGYAAGSGVLTLAAGGGAMFPSLSAGQWYRITVIQRQWAYSPSATLVNYTIYKATAVSGDTLTIAGPIEGTTDRNYAPGDVVEVRVTAGTIGDLQGAVGALEAAAVTTAGRYDDPSWITALDGGKITGDIAGNAASITGNIAEGQVTGLTSDLAAKAADAAVVHLAGSETITGAKTFSSTIAAPAGISGTFTVDGTTYDQGVWQCTNTGKGAMRVVTAGSTVGDFPDPCLFIGYNCDGFGGRPLGTEPYWATGWEGDYYESSSGKRFCEHYIQYVSPDGTVSLRPFFIRMNRAATDAATAMDTALYLGNPFQVATPDGTVQAMIGSFGSQFTGNLGVGITPQYPFHLKNDATADVQAAFVGATSTLYLGGNWIGGQPGLGTNDATPLNLITDNAAAIHIGAAGGITLGNLLTPPANGAIIPGPVEIGNASTPEAYFQVFNKPADSGSYSLSNWNGTGHQISGFIKCPTNNGGSTPAAGEPVLVLSREGVGGQAYGNFAEFLVRRWQSSDVAARTALDIALTHGPGDAAGTVVFTLQSDGAALLPGKLGLSPGFGSGNTSTLPATLSVGTGGAGNTAAVFQAAGNQTADVSQWQDSNGNTLSAVDANGYHRMVTGSGEPTSTPADGAVYIDVTNSRIYVRIGGVWKSATLS